MLATLSKAEFSNLRITIDSIDTSYPVFLSKIAGVVKGPLASPAFA